MEEIAVPSFLPNHNLIKSDVADYTMEIEWFDTQLGKMIQLLDEQGELENTIMGVTVENVMPNPSAKANVQELWYPGSISDLLACQNERERI